MAKMKEILNRIKQHLAKESQDRNTQIRAETTRATNAENTKIGKVANAVENNIPLFDSNGGIKDSGKSLADTGKIDSISIDGTPQVADANKNVDLPPYPTKQSLGLDNVDNTSDLNKPISTATQTALDLINAKIPSQASSSNQLADKEFVNSSIATNTAEFQGTFNNVNLLPTTGVDNNDYAFVITTDALGNTAYNRYKYVDDTGWLFEYTLNNSSFTSEQWSAINSGITQALVGKITTNETAISNIKDGTNINSFADVENEFSNIKDGQNIDSFSDVESALGLKANTSDVNTALNGKLDKNQVGVITLTTVSGTLTSAQYSELQKDIAIIKYGNITLYKEDLEVGANSNTLVFASKIKTSTISGTYVQISQDIVSIDTTSLAYTYTENAIINTYNKTQMDSLLSDKQDTISDLATIRSGASAGATAVQDASYVHTDNNYTTNEKNKLDGIENGAEANDVNSVNGKNGIVLLDSDDIDDTNASNKFVTSTEKSNISKSLYNVGSFDTYSVSNGKVSVVRQTLKTDLGSLSWSYNSGNSVFYAKLSTLKTSMYLDEEKSIKCPIYTTYNGSTLSSMSDNSITATYIGSNQDIAIKDTSCNGDVNTLLAKVNGVYIEYLTNSTYFYTDVYDENTPNIALDQNGANWLREEYEKGLNLLPNSKNVTLYHDVYYNLPLKKGTYTISVSNYASSGQFLVVGAISGSSSVSVLANLVNTNGVATFTITQDNYTLQRFYVENSTTTNIMLNKGSHAIPYQEYNGAIVREKDIEPVLLWENSSPNSDYTGQVISNLTDLSTFKYIKILYKMNKSTGAIKSTTYVYSQGSQDYISVIGNISSQELYSRLITFSNANAITLGNGYYNGTQNNSAIIPIAIYGTNVL